MRKIILICLSAFIIAPLAALLQGCINTEAMVRSHRGEGAKKICKSAPEDINGAIDASYTNGRLYTVVKEDHAVFIKGNILNETTAIYLVPQSDGTTEIEVLKRDDHFLSPATYYRPEELQTLDSLIELAMIKQRGRIERAAIMAKGEADIAEMHAKIEKAGQDARDAYNAVQKEQQDFDAALKTYRAAKTKPALPEEARKYKVQAEAAIRDQDFTSAAGLFKKALVVAPWWPEGYFNLALVLGETGSRAQAAVEMKRYLQLVPNAPDAREAQDKIYEWER
jgi:tetratricopeptide (TPR) repeat protein